MSMPRTFRRLAFLAFFSLFAPSLMAGQAVDSLFSDSERQVIERYYGKAKAYLPGDSTSPSDRENRVERRENRKEDRRDNREERREDREDGRGKGKHGKHEKEKHGKEKGSKGGLPPGLAKKDQLPPGLAKRQVLPPGLERRPLPRELESQLPPAPQGTERVMVDQAVVLIDKVTNRVLDILTEGNR